jgi:hypothetical protein
MFRRKVVNLGQFKTAREAALAYDYVSVRVFGEFAKTNWQLTGPTGHWRHRGGCG